MIEEGWPGPRERKVEGVTEQAKLFVDDEEVEQLCFCCQEIAETTEHLMAWGLEVAVCEECAGRLHFVVITEAGSQWHEGGVVCEVHGYKTPLDCTGLSGRTPFPRKSKAGRTVYPEAYEGRMV